MQCSLWISIDYNLILYILQICFIKFRSSEEENNSLAYMTKNFWHFVQVPQINLLFTHSSLMTLEMMLGV